MSPPPLCQIVSEMELCIVGEQSVRGQKFVYRGVRHLRKLFQKFPHAHQAMQAGGGCVRAAQFVLTPLAPNQFFFPSL